jgi:hypothetical protein
MDFARTPKTTTFLSTACTILRIVRVTKVLPIQIGLSSRKTWRKIHRMSLYLSSNKLLKSLIAIKNTPIPGNDMECSKNEFYIRETDAGCPPSKEADIVIHHLLRGLFFSQKAIGFFSLCIGMPNDKHIDME